MKNIHSRFKLRQFLFFAVLLLLAACHKDPFDADSGTFTDKRDGHAYKWVKIGDQIWMAENLAYLPYVCSGDSQCGIWVYGYYGEGSFYQNYTTYGCLYDYETALEVCPKGWHLPSDEEWMELERFLGIPEDEIYDENVDRGEEVNAAGKLGAGSELWDEKNENSTNETGFSAKPGGMRTSIQYRSINTEAIFWTSSYDSYFYNMVKHRFISSYGIGVFRIDKKVGLSVRYVKD